MLPLHKGGLNSSKIICGGLLILLFLTELYSLTLLTFVFPRSRRGLGNYLMERELLVALC